MDFPTVAQRVLLLRWLRLEAANRAVACRRLMLRGPAGDPTMFIVCLDNVECATAARIDRKGRREWEGASRVRQDMQRKVRHRVMDWAQT